MGPARTLGRDVDDFAPGRDGLGKKRRVADEDVALGFANGVSL
jgi:hypothetical protein